MKKLKIKQGTRAWEEIKEGKIGSSEVFDIVRYYATEEELYNCGIDSQKFKKELPFVSTWALYHKMLGDGVYVKPLLAPELGEYGLAMEAYGQKVLQEGRTIKLKRGEVFASDNLIASLDISGIAESVDVKPFDFGKGSIKVGDKFVCEQKTISPYRDHLPFKYIIQAQYQITLSRNNFYILQAMILDNDTPYERGKIVSLAQTSKKKFFNYAAQCVSVQHIYFAHNEALSQLIRICLNRFFDDVKAKKEPRAFLESNTASDILMSVRQNSFYNPELIKEFDLTRLANCKKLADEANKNKQEAMQEIIDFAMANNCSRFISPSGHAASFSSNGRFLLKEPKVVVEYD